MFHVRDRSVVLSVRVPQSVARAVREAAAPMGGQIGPYLRQLVREALKARQRQSDQSILSD